MSLCPEELISTASNDESREEEEGTPQLTFDSSDEEIESDGAWAPPNTPHPGDTTIIPYPGCEDSISISHYATRQLKSYKLESEVIDPHVLQQGLAIFTVQTDDASIDLDFSEYLYEHDAPDQQILEEPEIVPNQGLETSLSQIFFSESYSPLASELEDEGGGIPQYLKDYIQNEAHQVGLRIADNMKLVIFQWATEATQNLAMGIIADAERAAITSPPHRSTVASHAGLGTQSSDSGYASATSLENPGDVISSFVKEKEERVTEAIRAHINLRLHELLNAALPRKTTSVPSGAPLPVAVNSITPVAMTNQVTENPPEASLLQPPDLYELTEFSDIFMARVPTPDFTVIGGDLEKAKRIMPVPVSSPSPASGPIARVSSRDLSHLVRCQESNAKKLARSLILSYLFLLAMPEEVPLNIFFQGIPAQESTATGNLDRHILRALIETAFSNRYWALDFTSLYCHECVEEIMQQRKRAFLKRWALKVKSNLVAFNHCPTCHCEHSHTTCDHSSEFHQWLHSVGNTVERLQYIRLMSRACSSINSESLASAINILKRHAHNILGAQVNLYIPGTSELQITDKTQIGRLVHCFRELEKLLPDNARLQILGLEFHPKMKKRWEGARRPWWVGTSSRDHLLVPKKSLEAPLPPLVSTVSTTQSIC